MVRYGGASARLEAPNLAPSHDHDHDHNHDDHYHASAHAGAAHGHADGSPNARTDTTDTRAPHIEHTRRLAPTHAPVPGE